MHSQKNLLQEVYKNLIDIVSQIAIEYKASDIHISHGDYICLRSKGVINRIDKYGVISREKSSEFLQVVFNIIGENNQNYVNFLKEELSKKGHVSFSFTIKNVRMRGNVANYDAGYYLVFRILSDQIPELNTLGFDQRALNGIERIINANSGLFLVTGATGSGKSTTLASIINEINRRQAKNIITMEDPVEYIYHHEKSHIIQKEKGRDFDEFKEALRSALREDPDVILVGEIRDGETLELALEMSETGHLVMGTLHTQSVVNTIGRMISMSEHKDLTRDKLSNVLLGIVSQKLYLEKNGLKRRLLYELLIFDKGVSNMVREGNTHQINGIIDTVEFSNSFNKCIREAYYSDLLTRDMAYSLSNDPKNLKLEEYYEKEQISEDIDRRIDSSFKYEEL